MVDFFTPVVERLIEVGFYNFLLPFILFVTLLYALFRKTQILGDSTVIHGILAVVFGLFVFGTPVILGISLVKPLTAFLTQGALVMLVFMIGFLIASFFYPNIMESLPEIFKSPGPATWIIWTIFIFGITFGMFTIGGGVLGNVIDQWGAPKELLLLTGTIIGVFVIFLLIAMGQGGSGG